MSFSIRYRPLFKVRVLHDYYLNRAGANDFLALGTSTTDDKERQSRLALYDINKVLQFVPTAATQKLLQQHHLRIRTGKDGFSVATKVSTNASGAIEPFIDLDTDMRLCFQLIVQEARFHNFTNAPLTEDLEAFYYFSNQDTADKTYPSLARTAPNFQNGRFYEMGSILQNGNNLYEAQQSNIGIGTGDMNTWKRIDNHQQVNLNDKNLVLSKEEYQFSPAENGLKNNTFAWVNYQLPNNIITNTATLTLEDKNGNQLQQTINGNGNNLKKLAVKFEGVTIGKNTLTISVNGFSDTRTIYIEPSCFEGIKNTTKHLGFIDVKLNNTGDFRVLEADKRLRMNAANTELETPTYEIRFRNRYTYWKYIPMEDEQASPNTPDVNSNIIDNEQVYVSKEAQPLLYRSKVAVRFNDDIPMLPNPTADQLLVHTNRIFSEVYLPILNT